MNAVAYGFYCKLVTTKADSGTKLVRRMCVIGKPSDAQTVVYMFSYLKNEVDRLQRRRQEQGWPVPQQLPVRGHGRSPEPDGGAASQAGSRRECRHCPCGHQERLKNGDADIAAYVKSEWETVKKSKPGVKVTRREAYNAGAAAARNIRLSAGPALGAGAKQLGRW
jgi:hypothetical protein